MGALADILVSRGGYNMADALNAEKGPRAAELAKEFGASTGSSSSGSGGGGGGGGFDVVGNAKELLGLQQEANKPAIETLKSGIQGVKDRYAALKEEMTGKMSTDLSREYGRRGISTSSGAFESDLTNKTGQLGRSIGGDEQGQISSILNAIAQLQAGGSGNAITGALGMANNALAQRSFEQSLIPQSSGAAGGAMGSGLGPYFTDPAPVTGSTGGAPQPSLQNFNNTSTQSRPPLNSYYTTTQTQAPSLNLSSILNTLKNPVQAGFNFVNSLFR